MKLTRFVSTLIVFSFSLIISIPDAKAETTLGDSALVIAYSTVGGAVLGASTLPFYEDPGDHTKNIFYGAAIGAVIGVIISAYAGVQDGPDYSEEEEALLYKGGRKPSSLAINESPELRLRAELSTTTRKLASTGPRGAVLWSPLASVRF